MLTSFEIRRFRAIKECKIEGLSQINIFMGRNNSGKTSILEALYLASAAFNIEEPLTRGNDKVHYLLNRRSERGLHWKRKEKDTLWNRYDSTHPIEIEVRSRKQNRVNIELHEWHPHPLIKVPITQRREEFYKRIGLMPDFFHHFCLIDQSILHRRSSRSLSHSDMIEFEEILAPDFPAVQNFMKSVMFVDSDVKKNMEKVEKAIWMDLLDRRLDKLITKVLRNGYGVDAEDLTYVPYADRYQLAIKLPKTTRRVDDLGDGARSSMVLLMVAALAKDTAMLIEEPENHQHPGGLAKSLEMLLDLVKQNNIQLFVSTHSIEFSKIIDQISKERKIDLLTFFIERDKKGIVDAREVKPEDANNLEKMGFDLRFLDLL